MQIFTGYRIERRKKMTRYTKKIDKNYSCKMNEYMWTDKSYNHSRLGIDKLGKLEDIEEELGVDLIKPLNAKKVYVLDYGKPYETWSPSINFKTRKIYTIDEITRTICGQYDIKDYGKTWAFTKEELEK